MKYIIAFAAAALTLSSCSRENLLPGAGDDGFVKYEVAMSGSSEVLLCKSGVLTSEDGSMSVPMSLKVEDGIGIGTPSVKGAMYNSEEEMRKGGVTSFTVGAWNDDYTGFIPNGTTVRYSIGMWKSEVKKEWTPENSTKTFLAYVNLDPATASVTNTCATGGTTQTLTYSVPTNARQQNDIMLGWYNGNGDGKNTASITMVHPLTALVFKKGQIDGLKAIKSISVSGVYASGTATLTYTAGKIPPAISWGATDTRTGSKNVVLMPEGDATKLEVGADNVIGVPFIILPQTVTANQVHISVVATIGGEDVNLTASLPAGTLEEGKSNVFTLGYDMDYHFTVDAPLVSFSTTAEDSRSITVTSTNTNHENIAWTIKSVQFGNEEAEAYEGSFSKNGLTVAVEGDALKITSLSRTAAAVNPGTAAYWSGGNSYWSPEDWSGKGVIDLSKLDFQSETTDNAMTTANCYIIRHAGKYKLPLVYGNAIVNGAFNEQAYYPNCKGDVSGGTNRLEIFQNHLGKGIISPFIEYNTTDGKAKSGDNKYLATATGEDGYQIVWDEAGIISIDGISKETVTVRNASGSMEAFDVSYLYFTISQSAICQSNALIAVKDGNGNIMWSWHIWTTNDPALLADPIPVTNYTDVEYKFFPLYNIGWIDASTVPGFGQAKIIIQQEGSGREIEIAVTQPSVATAAGNGCWYQFGRKDPMPTDKVTGFTPNVSGGSTLSNAICNPGNFYNGASYNWCSTRYDNLWTGKKSATGTIDKDADMIKTIYDPSPVGYKMPASNAFTGFTTKGSNIKDKTLFNVSGSFDKGWYFYTVKSSEKTESTPTVFFPAAGYRNYRNGSVGDVGSYGGYWSAVPYDDATNVYNLSFESSNVLPVDYSRRAYGFSVRPVQE